MARRLGQKCLKKLAEWRSTLSVFLIQPPLNSITFAMPLKSLLKKIERAVDYPKFRLAFWTVWLVAAVPCLLVSLLGVYFGGVMVIRPLIGGVTFAHLSAIALGFSGLLGICGAAIRLANTAGTLSESYVKRYTAKLTLMIGLLSATFPAVSVLITLKLSLEMLWVVPFIIGLFLFLGTIGIQPRGRETS